MKDPGFAKLEPKQGLSAVVVITLGCGMAMMLGFALLCGGVVYFARAGLGQYERQGHERVKGQVISVDQPVSSSAVYTGQLVKIRADAINSVGIIMTMRLRI